MGKDLKDGCWLFRGLVPAFAGMTCIGTCFYGHLGVAVFSAPPPAPFQGRRVAFALRLSQEVGSWGRMYCPGPELRSQA